MNRIFHSERYLGAAKKNYFEGWYFKHTVGGKIFAFIVGICKNKVDSHCFVQFISGQTTLYFRYQPEEFCFDKNNMSIKIGQSEFSLSGAVVDLDDGQNKIYGGIKYKNHQLFQKSAYAPSVMGPFSYLNLGCNHAVVSMNFEVQANLKILDTQISGTGTGYIEKDFGKAFPKNYLWAQAQNTEFSVVFALAYPLTMGLKGYLCVANLQGKQHNFSLYSGARLDYKTNDRGFEATICKRKDTLKISVEAQGDGQVLLAPVSGGNMNLKIKENVCGTAHILFEQKNSTQHFVLPCAFEKHIVDCH